MHLTLENEKPTLDRQGQGDMLKQDGKQGI
jgi:hypothetical protein